MLPYILVKIINMDRSRVTSKDHESIEDLLCIICKNITINPHECSKCQGTFCYSCLTQWNQRGHGHFCPVSRCFPTNYRPANKFFIALLNQLRFSCQFKETGCEENLKLSEMESHELNCDFKGIKCKFPECAVIILQKLIEDHH
jgi:hypothetical protein